MKKLLVIAVACSLVLTGLTSSVQANGCGGSPFCNSGPYAGTQGGLFGLFAKSPMPAFQAAPWYHYYPYNSHFLTPAPMMSPYYAPPYVGGAYSGGFGGGMTNPFFPTAPQVMPAGPGR